MNYVEISPLSDILLSLTQRTVTSLLVRETVFFILCVNMCVCHLSLISCFLSHREWSLLYSVKPFFLLCVNKLSLWSYVCVSSSVYVVVSSISFLVLLCVSIIYEISKTIYLSIIYLRVLITLYEICTWKVYHIKYILRWPLVTTLIYDVCLSI